MFGFSILGQYIVINVFHFPYSLMEIYFLPIIYVKRYKIVKTFKKLTSVTLIRALLYLLLLVGAIYGVLSTFDVGILMSYRSILYMFICFFYMQKKETSCTIDDIQVVSFSAVIGECIYVVGISTSTVVSSTNVIAIALAIMTAFFLEKYIIATITILISLFLTINTGFRIGIVVVALCVVEMVIFTIVRTDRRAKFITIGKRIIIFMLVITAALYFITNYEEIIKSIADLTGMSSFAVFRITSRMQSLFSFDFETSQDTGRLEVFSYAIQRIWQIIPRGLIGESIGEYWLYIDIPIIYLYDLFGSIASYVLIAWVIRILIYNLAKYKSNNNSQLKLLCIWLIPVLCLLFVVNGSFMVIVYQAIETGLILGILANKYSLI